MEGIKEFLKGVEERVVSQTNTQELKQSSLIKCPKCGNEKKEYENCEECEKVKKIKSRMITIPTAFIDIFTDKKDMFEKSLNKNVFIHGAPGVGKTVFGCSLLKHYAQDGRIIFISYPAWILRLQSAYRKNEENPFDMAEEIARFHGWLLIDDIGAEKLTDYVRQITYYIINEREQWKLPTIITSNFSLMDIDQQIDRRISSRIAGMCKVLNFKGIDKRIK